MKQEFVYGEIESHVVNNEIFIDFFNVFPTFRGQGYGNKLMVHLPKRCWLYAYPNQDSKQFPGLDMNSLKKFYRKHGFRFFYDERRNRYFGFRGFYPTQKFWNTLNNPFE